MHLLNNSVPCHHHTSENHKCLCRLWGHAILPTDTDYEQRDMSYSIKARAEAISAMHGECPRRPKKDSPQISSSYHALASDIPEDL